MERTLKRPIEGASFMVLANLGLPGHHQEGSFSGVRLVVNNEVDDGKNAKDPYRGSICFGDC